MKNPKFWTRFFLVAAILTAIIIFYFSAQKGTDSSVISDRITHRIVHLFKHYRKLSKSERRSFSEAVSTLVRKNGHFCEFMLLGFNLMGFFRFRDMDMSRRDCRLRAWGLATLYGAMDELHQLFINERAAMVTDVLIDSAGGLVGTLVMTLLLVILAKLTRRRTI